MNIQEIHIDRRPVIVISDSHCNLSNIRKLKELYPNELFISLGDFTFLFAKEGEKFNEYSIQYFIDNNIPALEGNHECHISGVESGNHLLVLDKNHTIDSGYNLPKHQIEYLSKLPRGFKLILPNGFNYCCYHNEPQNLWNFPDNITKEYFKSNYIFDSKTLGVVQGHLHLNRVDNFTPKRYVLGQLCGSNHHKPEEKSGNNYGLITEKGFEFKKI